MNKTFIAIFFILLFACDQRQEEQADGCWVTLYNAPNYKGKKLIFNHELDLLSMKFKREGWRGDVKSILVGPSAEVLLYREENFKNHLRTLLPKAGIDGREDLSLSQVGSLKLNCK